MGAVAAAPMLQKLVPGVKAWLRATAVLPATPVSWNIVPNGRDAIMGVRYDPSQTVFGTVVYRRYSRGWKHPMRNLPPGQGDDDGMPGPLIRARVVCGLNSWRSRQEA